MRSISDEEELDCNGMEEIIKKKRKEREVIKLGKKTERRMK